MINLGGDGHDSIFVKLDNAARDMATEYRNCYSKKSYFIFILSYFIFNLFLGNGTDYRDILGCIGNLTGEHLKNFGTYAGNSCKLLAETTAELGRVTHTLSITAQNSIYDSVMNHVLTPMIDSFENPTLS